MPSAVGPHTVWPGSKSTRIRDAVDGTANVIVLVEVANSGIQWMEPRDLHVTQMATTINPKFGQGISSFHSGGATVAYVDGSTQFLPDDLTQSELQALLTTDDGK